ncbi:MAG TPA: peptidase S41, partial [Spirochaetaceae bacterium]|nr:peptidase S41 [Spirochaetaceae bacterium]
FEFVDRLLRDELDRTKTAPIYDLEFDAQLNKAIETILGGDFNELLRNSRTLSQILTAK